jgi:hypothetical protein
MNLSCMIVSHKTAVRLLIVTTFVVLAAGCRSIGPGTIPRDRLSYSTTLAKSWKEQMLLNLVKTRYLDLPIYLEVGQIVSGYSLETGVQVFGQVSPQNMRGDTFGGVNAHGTFTDRPTITYTPLTGDKFLQGFLTPIHPAKVFSLVQSGYAADFILELSVESLNGLRNRPVSLGSRQKADPEFFRALALMREIQDAGAIGLRLEKPTNAQPTAIVFFRSDKIESAMQAKIDDLRNLLGLTPGQSSYRLVQTPLKGGVDELGVACRSLSQLIAALALGVEIPASHQQRKLPPPVHSAPATEDALLRIHSGSKEPKDAFAAVPYEGEWFWIANDDWKSKRTFSSTLFLFTLADSGNEQKLPTITIPAQ